MTQLGLIAPERDAAFVPALLSPCGRFRYELRRECSPGSWSKGPLALLCGANPSKADAVDDDHTIRKEIGFTQRWGCGGLIKLNLLAWRETDPKRVPTSYDATGWPQNEYIWMEALQDPRVKIVVAAWGDCLRKNGWANDQAKQFLMLAKRFGHDVQCFGRTKIGNPLHPLMLSYATPLVPYEGDA